MRRIALLFMALAIGLSLSAQQTFEVELWPDGLPNTNGIDHLQENLDEHNYHPTMTAYLPDPSIATGRAVVVCPGGGYGVLVTTYEGHDWAPFFNKQGIAMFMLKYRMPRGNREVPIADATQAIHLIRQNAAKWNINPYDVGIMGASAGGHLASTIATHTLSSLRPNFQILFYPVISMQPGMGHDGTRLNFLGADAGNEVLQREYSNEQHVRRHITPPALILLSNDDRMVPPVTNAVAYYSALRRNQVFASMNVYPTGDHGFVNNFKNREQMLNDITQFMSVLWAPRRDAVRVACIGNSITDGSGIDMSDLYGYPAQLQQLLGDGYYVRNYGVGARTMLNKGDYPYMKEYAWADCKDFNPDIAIVKLGTNDSKPYNWKYKDEFEGDMQQMIDELKALPSKPKIYMVLPLKCWNQNISIRDEVIREEVIPIIKKLAKKNNCETIDLYNLMINDEALMLGDKLHPNAKGARRMAEHISAAIKK